MNEQLKAIKKRQALLEEKRLDIVMAFYHRVDTIGLRTLGRAAGILNERYELKRHVPGKLISLRSMPDEKPQAISISQLVKMAGLTEKEISIKKKYVSIINNTLEKYMSGEISLDDFDFSKNTETEEQTKK